VPTPDSIDPQSATSKGAILETRLTRYDSQFHTTVFLSCYAFSLFHEKCSKALYDKSVRKEGQKESETQLEVVVPQAFNVKR
jgi:hypothetical protein